MILQNVVSWSCFWLCFVGPDTKTRSDTLSREEGFWDEGGFQTLISDRVQNLKKMSPHSWSRISIIPFQEVLSHTDVCTGRHCSFLFVVLINCMLRSPCFDRNHKGLLLFGCFCLVFHNKEGDNHLVFVVHAQWWQGFVTGTRHWCCHGSWYSAKVLHGVGYPKCS